jgi:uncharacterized membrane protein YbhN (UPF0104 family)
MSGPRPSDDGCRQPEAGVEDIAATNGDAAAPGWWRSRLLLPAKLALAGGLLLWLVSSDRLQLDKFLAVSLSGELLLFVAIVLLSMAVPAVRWWWLLRVQELQVPLRQVFRLTWAGYFTGLLLPGAASGDLAKGYLIVRGRQNGRIRALSTVLVDRVIGVYSLLFLGSLSALWLIAGGRTGGPDLAMGLVAVLLLLILTLGGAALLLAPSRRLLLRVLPLRWRLTVEHSLEFYAQHKASLLGCFCLSIVTSAGTLIAFALAAELLGGGVFWSATFIAGPLVIVANCLPLTPGGLGVGETVSHSLYTALGTSCGAEIMALVRVAMAVLALPGLVALLAPDAAPAARAQDPAPSSQAALRNHPDGLDRERFASGAVAPWAANLLSEGPQ